MVKTYLDNASRNGQRRVRRCGWCKTIETTTMKGGSWGKGNESGMIHGVLGCVC